MFKPLLKPRFKQIADYPNSPQSVGHIFESFISDEEPDALLIEFIETYRKYPAIYKELKWWENRAIEELPEYIYWDDPFKSFEHKPSQGFEKVEKWEIKPFGTVAYIGKNSVVAMSDSVIPISKNEYDTKKVFRSFEDHKEEIQMWIDALRSGKYQQTTTHLQDRIGYCCLGVACDVFIVPEFRFNKESDVLYGFYPSAQPNAPEWLKHIDADFCKKTGMALTRLNDEYMWSFNEIAEVLEKVYIKGELFKLHSDYFKEKQK